MSKSLGLILMAGGLWFLLVSPVSAETGNPDAYRYEAELAEFKKGEMKRYSIFPVHPYAFELKTLQNSMWALAYQHRDISWSKKKHVFGRPAIEALSPRLLALFRQTGKRQRVVFRIIKPSGKTLFAGDVFLTPDGLNWRVTNFKGSRKKVDDFSVMGDSERLVPMKGQVYKIREERTGVIQNITNWIIFPAISPEKNRILPATLSGESRGSLSAEKTVEQVKKRLKVLETLKNEGVITDQEYQKRREEILQGF